MLNTPAPSLGRAESAQTTISPSYSKRSFDDMSDSDDGDASVKVEEYNDTPLRKRKPMRKRAKTQEEKEQRQHERIMRNRAAAQISRERKREYVAHLEVEKVELCDQVTTLSAQNTDLRKTVDTLSTRLAAMERTLQFFMPTSQARTINDAPELQTKADSMPLPTPPGTIRPIDLLSVASSTPYQSTTPVMEAIDQRNPAASVDELSMDSFFSVTDISPDGEDSSFLADYTTADDFDGFCETHSEHDHGSTTLQAAGILA